MERLVTAVDANRHFSEILRAVREGGSYVVTAHGKPVARILPIEEGPGGRDEARRRLLRRLREETPVDVGPIGRDELYER
ncbi:prevent-host-death family protein [Arboricoccus pini]|uniref:Antitoxin n=1 Tax=Arboricoccus pini TaxID=1963835 RepID=A0A212RYI2_9PROT|nr:type II toxin-antitoxin system prevent-host-death family antitoxin [Arboricoccus pini]SNB77705.1 prevent-host-death family protein [Arboricoccus pini]